MTRPAPTRVLLTMAFAFAAGTASACWEQAAERYSVNPYLLAAIAKTESGFNPTAVRHNTNNTRDLGVMQINTVHLDELAKFGITESHLLDPCTNIAVGACTPRPKPPSELGREEVC